MRKQITAKDVLYALQYMNERLVMQPGGKWTLEPSRQVVPGRVADEAKASGCIVGLPDRGGVATYVWRAAA